MTATWLAVLGCGVGCYLLKLAGLSVPAHLLERPVVRRIADLIPVALLAALIATQVFAAADASGSDAGGGQHLVVDARLAGLAVAAIALLLRAPFLVVVVLSALTAALLRLL